MTEFVVDACILRSAGFGTDPASVDSREFIEQVLSGRYQVFASMALEAEWMRHASKLALSWMASMESHGLIIRAEPNPFFQAEIDRQISKLDPSYIRCAEKDSHLVLVALIYFAVVVSAELRSRNVFQMLAHGFDMLHEVRWVAPRTFLNHGFKVGGVRAYPAEWSLSH